MNKLKKKQYKAEEANVLILEPLRNRLFVLIKPFRIF